MKHGYSKHWIANDDYYEGTWRYDRLDGAGTFLYSNGDMYVGMFRDGNNYFYLMYIEAIIYYIIDTHLTFKHSFY